MAPAEWTSMGGQFCNGPCSGCRQSEWSLSNYLGREQTNIEFKKHWETWFTQEDVDGIIAAGMNTVRIPLGFWIVEDLVDTATEPYAQGGLDELVSFDLCLRESCGQWFGIVADEWFLPRFVASTCSRSQESTSCWTIMHSPVSAQARPLSLSISQPNFLLDNFHCC